MLLERFPDLRDLRVLDIGGTVESWQAAPVQPTSLVLLNMEFFGLVEPRTTWRLVTGDACDPPAELVGQRFDLVFSNSVIEHVGGHARRQAFAATVLAYGEHHWVQTPYRYFPLEPHWVFPGMQFMPLAARAQVSARWPLGWLPKSEHPDPVTHVELVLGVDLLSKTSLHHYFPASELLTERVGPLTKSLIAVA